MRYRIRSINLNKKLAERDIPDLSLLPTTQKLAIFTSLGITFVPRVTTTW